MIIYFVTDEDRRGKNTTKCLWNANLFNYEQNQNRIKAEMKKKNINKKSLVENQAQYLNELQSKFHFRNAVFSRFFFSIVQNYNLRIFNLIFLEEN